MFALRVLLKKPMLQQRNFSAACCIIGDEILNGKTRDSNTYFLGKKIIICFIGVYVNINVKNSQIPV